MKPSNVLNSIGLALLAAVFLWAAQRALRPADAERDAAGVKTIRFAHWQLEGGLREAFDQLARDYEKLHPGVRIEQVPVPERIFAQWLNTQLIGGTATDLVALGKGSNDEIIARHFTPLSEIVEAPNPYNRGTPLEGVPLRETILDGMQSTPNYVSNLLEYYAVPTSMFTVRIFYNRDLWRATLGDTPPPADFTAYIELCKRVSEHAERTGVKIIPVVGSRANGAPVIDRLFASQTQRVNQRIDLFHDLKPTGQAAALAYLRGDWTLDEPALRRALEISREAGLRFQPGYLQIERADAAFQFVQGRALMIATGSWDSPSFRQQAGFEIGVFDIPIPGRDHERYGEGVLGPAAENDVGTALSFGIPRATPNFELALDFLLFLSSQPGNTEFSRHSGWLPAAVGVEPDPVIAPFLPRQTGYVSGFVPSHFGTDTNRVFNAQSGLLVSPPGSVEAFVDSFRPQLATSIRDDLRRDSRNATVNITRQDIILAGLEGLRRHQEPGLDGKISRLLEAQNRREARIAWQNHELNRTESNR